MILNRTRRFALIFSASASLLGCETTERDSDVRRMDGKDINSSPELQQQYYGDYAECIERAQRIRVPMAAIPFQSGQGSINIAAAAMAGQSAGAQGQALRARENLMQACMGEKGYISAPRR